MPGMMIRFLVAERLMPSKNLMPPYTKTLFVSLYCEDSSSSVQISAPNSKTVVTLGVRADILVIGHVRTEYVNIGHAWLQVAD